MNHREGWNAVPKWSAQWRRGLIGPDRYASNLNGHTDVALFDTLAEAERDAARRNYAAGSYPLPRLLGL